MPGGCTRASVDVLAHAHWPVKCRRLLLPAEETCRTRAWQRQIPYPTACKMVLNRLLASVVKAVKWKKSGVQKMPRRTYNPPKSKTALQHALTTAEYSKLMNLKPRSSLPDTSFFNTSSWMDSVELTSWRLYVTTKHLFLFINTKCRTLKRILPLKYRTNGLQEILWSAIEMNCYRVFFHAGISSSGSVDIPLMHSYSQIMQVMVKLDIGLYL